MGTIDADYLVVGAGATAMAFVDILASETAASVVVVDRNHRPGRTTGIRFDGSTNPA